MRKPTLIALALFLFCAAGRADTSGIEAISELRKHAQNPTGTLSERLCAIDGLGQFYSWDCESLMLLKSVFKDLLAKPATAEGEDFKHNLLFFHVARAISNHGPSMRELAPDLIAKLGRDRILDCAIEGALAKILCSPLPPVMMMLPPGTPVPTLPPVPGMPVVPVPGAWVQSNVSRPTTKDGGESSPKTPDKQAKSDSPQPTK